MSTSANYAFLGERDGAGAQAVAVRAYLSYFASGIEASFKDGNFRAEPVIHRWMNGREQGYVVQMNAPSYTGPQINIAFFEHRNSDSIVAVMFEAETYGEVATLKHVPEGVYDTKHDVTHRVGAGEAMQMAEWIIDQLETFWKKNVTDTLPDDRVDIKVTIESEFPISETA